MEEIYQQYSTIVYKYLCSLTNDTELSKELMQETFYSAIKGISNFKNEEQNKQYSINYFTIIS